MKNKKAFLLIIALISSVYIPYSVSAHVTISDGTDISCGGLDSIDLTTHTTNQIQSRISQTNPTDGISLFSNRDFDLASTTHPWTPNPNSWTKKGTPLDFTGVAAYNLFANGTAIAPNSLGALISPRHFLAAAHYAPNIGQVLGFIDASGNRIERTVTGRDFVGGTDIAIGVLDSDLPDSVTYYPLIASTTLSTLIQTYIGQSNTVPIVMFDQEAKALIHSISSLGDFISYGLYSSGDFAPYSESIISGDSSNPEFILIGNQPVLLSTTYSSAGGGGPNAGAYLSQINTIMTNLGGGYQATVYDPACFIRYPANHRPTFNTQPSTNIITYEHVDPTTPLITYSATDTDSGQSLTYGLQSLSNATSSFNPADYFRIDSTTGALYQTHDMSVATLGTNLTLTVSVTDSATYPAQNTLSNPVGLRQVPQAGAKIILDPSFTLPTIAGNTSALFVDNDNKVIIGGIFNTVNGVTQNDIARLESDGALDTTFAANIGTGILNWSGQSANVSKIFTDSDNKIIFLSDDYINFNNVTGCNLGRLNSDGSLDTTFVCAANGYGFTINGNSGANIYAGVNIGNKLLLGGNFNNYNGATTSNIVLLNNDGSLDTSFNTTIGTGLDGTVKAIAYDGNHNFYAAGLLSQYVSPLGATTTVRRIAKFDIDGTFDPSFSANNGTGFGFATINDMKIRPDGKIVVVGSFSLFNGVSTRRILLIGSDGTLDTSFATNTGTGFVGGLPYSILVQDDNKIIVAGSFTTYNNIPTNGLVRLNADGTLDTDFQNSVNSGITGTVVKVARRSDGALVTLGGTDYNGTLLNYGPAELITETPAAPVFTVTTAVGNYDASLLGTGSSTAVVSIYEGTNLLGTTTVGTSGVWQKTVSLTQGVHILNAKQTLSLLNTATSSMSSNVVVTIIPASSSGGGSTGGGGGGGGTGGIIYPSKNSTTPTTGTTTVGTSLVVPLAKISKLSNKNVVGGASKTLLSAIKINLVGNSVQVNSVPLVSNQTLGVRGEEVRQLQKLLNALGFSVSKIGSGSSGQETTNFGVKTQYALAQFQKANGISPASGYFGPLTRAKILSLLR